mgnify:CR=1 FL=1
MSETYQPSEKAVKIIEKIKEMTATPAIFIERKDDKTKPSLFDSKFGGLPYWDMNREYPTDCNGKKMMLLAQINFSDLKEFEIDLPKEGILQFFIQTDDDVFGMDFDEPTSQKGFRIVFHETIDKNVTSEQVSGLDLVRAEENEEYSPVYFEAALSFRLGTDYMNPSVAGFYDVFAQAVKTVTGDEIEDGCIYSYFDEGDDSYMYDELSGLDHKILGYPGFIQADPREDMSEEEMRYYDTVLLQIDSDMSEDGQDYVLWGDCGIANFFMNREALKKKDFSNVLYNWDCS